MKLLLSHIPSPIGTISLVTDGEALRALEFDDYEPRLRRLLTNHYGTYTLTRTDDSGRFGHAVQAYFEGDMTAFDAIPIRTGGTDFQNLVWAGLRTIPSGTTTSYGELAARIGRAGANRAVGMANGANPVAIAIPCHRVIGANATLTGYGGGLARKAWLIDHERRHAAHAAAAD